MERDELDPELVRRWTSRFKVLFVLPMLAAIPVAAGAWGVHELADYGCQSYGRDHSRWSSPWSRPVCAWNEQTQRRGVQDQLVPTQVTPAE